MLECLILGDSIAVGTGMQRPECGIYAKGGINSWQWNNKYGTKDLAAKTVIISLGSNDHQYIKTKRELETTRMLVKADRVYWILPHGNLKASNVDITRVQEDIKTIAKQYGDTVLPITGISSDNIHPTGRGYKELADQTR
jgi:lysophospholipase L1-like esterase